ncbi:MULTISPECIES: hypothetical protein [Actibacterium]|uniref:EF-hand domain-containing protein n=1 Tax=Actibacterium naphthalenivorans TaxID=1614693 RepID=A0A840CK42_9RHOB|nr:MULTISPECIES: hypothetical protein [Actibacterium]MBB4023549.1 hypothetical protein [Actibacterium naphthalenivorans]
MKLKITILTATLALSGAALAAGDFAAFDSDGDGKLSMEEMLVAYPDLTEEEFAGIDTDGDGFLNEGEVAAAEEGGELPMSE